MLELLRHELYKIFRRKSIYIAIILFLGLTVLSAVQSMKYDKEMMGDFNHFLEKHLEYAGPITQEKFEKAHKGQTEILELDISKVTGDIALDLDVYNRVVWAQNQIDSNQEKLRILREEIESLKGDEANQYVYKVKKVQYDMEKRVISPQPNYIRDWWKFMDTIDFTNSYGMIIVGALILLGISPVFSNEYGANMESLILSSKNGKGKLITAKVLSSIIYITAVVLFFSLVNLGIQLYHFGDIGWSTPLQSARKYINSPYGYTMAQYHIRQVATHLFGSIAFGMLVLLISVLSKSSLMPFFVGGMIFGGPILIKEIDRLQFRWIRKVLEFSYTEIIRVERLYSDFRVYKILGRPVLYLNLLLVVFTVITAIVVYLVYNRFRNHQVN